MNKREAILPIAFITLSVLFVLISAMVYFSGGKSKRWVAWKMKIGGLLLTLSFFSCGNSQNRNIITVENTCYMIVLGSSKKSIEIDSNRIIYVSIGQREAEKYSYTILDYKGITKQKGEIFPKRYLSMPYDDEFVIELNRKFETGIYLFKLYGCKLEEQDTMQVIYEQEFNIKNE